MKSFNLMASIDFVNLAFLLQRSKRNGLLIRHSVDRLLSPLFVYTEKQYRQASDLIRECH